MSSGTLIGITGSSDTGGGDEGEVGKIMILLSRQNVVTFYQLFYCHALILTMHTINMFVSAWRNHWLLVVSMDILIENILVPVFWFYSAWANYEDLWSKRNTFWVVGKKEAGKFHITGDWEIERGLSRTEDPVRHSGIQELSRVGDDEGPR